MYEHALLVSFLDPACVGALLLVHWNLPEEICGPVLHQRLPAHFPPRALPAAHREAIVDLYVADLLADQHRGRGEDEETGAWVEEYLHQRGLSLSTMEAFLHKSIRWASARDGRNWSLPLTERPAYKQPEDLPFSEHPRP